jgi:hypothetical protein
VQTCIVHYPDISSQIRDAGDRHAAAERNLFGRLLGCLHHCLATSQAYDEATAFPSHPATPAAA